MIFEFLQNAIVQIKQDIENIEIVKAALYASSLGTILYFLRFLPARALNLITRLAVYSIEVNNNDPAYVWLQKWLSKHTFSKRARHLVVSTNKYREVDDDGYESHERNEDEVNIAYKPDVGRYLMYYKRFPILLSIDRERIEERNMYAESLRFTALFRKKLLKELVGEASQCIFSNEKKTISLYMGKHDYWTIVGEKPFRLLSSLVYPKSLGEGLLNDAKQFLARKTWYQEMGIPWRRGYLLYGPPGNGKTSLAFALASELKFDIYCLNLAGSGVNDDILLSLLNEVPEKSILLIEEIDEAFKKKNKKADKLQQLTHTGLLNALDGVTSREGRITVMTTNYKECISPALIRPGRADLHIYVGNATTKQAQVMYERFYPTQEAKFAHQFAAKIANLSREVSMAELQNLLLSYQGEPLLTIDKVFDCLGCLDLPTTKDDLDKAA